MNTLFWHNFIKTFFHLNKILQCVFNILNNVCTDNVCSVLADGCFYSSALAEAVTIAILK